MPNTRLDLDLVSVDLVPISCRSRADVLPVKELQAALRRGHQFQITLEDRAGCSQPIHHITSRHDTTRHDTTRHVTTCHDMSRQAGGRWQELHGVLHAHLPPRAPTSAHAPALLDLTLAAVPHQVVEHPLHSRPPACVPRIANTHRA